MPIRHDPTPSPFCLAAGKFLKSWSCPLIVDSFCCFKNPNIHVLVERTISLSPILVLNSVKMSHDISCCILVYWFKKFKNILADLGCTLVSHPSEPLRSWVSPTTISSVETPWTTPGCNKTDMEIPHHHFGHAHSRDSNSWKSSTTPGASRRGRFLSG